MVENVKALVEPVAWRVLINQDGKTFNVYTERLPYEPDETMRIRIKAEPEALVPLSVLEAQAARIAELERVSEKALEQAENQWKQWEARAETAEAELAKLRAQPAVGGEAEPFMYGVMGPDGKAAFDEFCVNGDAAELKDAWEDEPGYRVVPLFLHPSPSGDAVLSELLANCAQLIQSIKEEWSVDGSWSEWDESVQKSLSAYRASLFEAALSASPQRDEAGEVEFQPCVVINSEVGLIEAIFEDVAYIATPVFDGIHHWIDELRAVSDGRLVGIQIWATTPPAALRSASPEREG